MICVRGISVAPAGLRAIIFCVAAAEGTRLRSATQQSQNHSALVFQIDRAYRFYDDCAGVPYHAPKSPSYKG